MSFRKTTYCQDCWSLLEFTSDDVFIDKNEDGEEAYAVRCKDQTCHGSATLNAVKTKYGVAPKP